MTAFQQTHITVVLDRSGSMDACRQQTVDAFNTYLREARGDQHLREADFGILQFDTQSITEMRVGAPINLEDLTLDDFVPRGGTPLYDAIGRGVDRLDAALKKSGSTKAILVILTDGQENASRKHTHESISGLIKERQDKGWLLVFLGAGLDVARVGVGLGISTANVASYGFDAASMQSVARSLSSSTQGYAATADSAGAKSWMAAGGGAFTPEQRANMNAGQNYDLNQPAAPPAASPVAFQGSTGGDTWQSGNKDAWNQ